MTDTVTPGIDLFDPKQRFTPRAENYVKYRPKYPASIVEFLSLNLGLTRQCIVADMGAGTGFLSEVFLKNGNKVFGIEPNNEMRSRGEQYLDQYPDYRSMDTEAENTGLPDNSVDFIGAAAAVHWFDQTKAHIEFQRILKDDGWLFIVHRKKEEIPIGFESELYEMRKSSVKYPKTGHSSLSKEEQLSRIFGENSYSSFELPPHYEMLQGYEALKGWLLSMSGIPFESDPEFEEIDQKFRPLFDKYAEKDMLRVRHDFLIYYGQLSPKQ